MIDYKTDHVPHTTEVQQRMKAMQNAFLKGNYDEAVTQGNTALVELRLAVVAIKDLVDRQKHRK